FFKGADVNRATNSNDSTVLSLACAGGHLDVASLLLKHGSDPNHLLKDRSNCLIEAAKGGHTEIVKLLLEYPKSVAQRTPIVAPTSSIETLTNDVKIENDEEKEQSLTVTMPTSFLLPSSGDSKKSSPTTNSPIQLLQSLQKIVPRNILDVLQTGVNETVKLNSDTDAKDNSLSNNDQSSSSSSPPVSNVETVQQSLVSNQNSDINNVQQATKLQILGKNKK
ncbi:unnamed protein product, partial [Rotaria magnacalcarata]